MVGPFVFPCGDFVKDGTDYFISWCGGNIEVGALLTEEEEEGAEEEGAEEEEEAAADDSE